jgi:hypothetical protein
VVEKLSIALKQQAGSESQGLGEDG